MTSCLLEDRTVLLADDEKYSQQVFGAALKGLGAPELLIADNGAEAMNMLSKSALKVDLIISDFNMPVVHGLQLLKAVRVGLKNIDRATPFAMLTGYSDKRLVDMALALDVNAFLIKPISREALAKRLAKLVSLGPADRWLKEAESYAAIDVDEALNEIATPEATPEQAHDLPLMPMNKALFRRTRPSKGPKGVPVRGLPEKAIGVGTKGLPPEAAKNAGVEAGRQANRTDDWSQHKRPQLEGELYSIDKLPEHAILAKDVYTADGRLFIHAGTELTPRIVSILHDLQALEHMVEKIWVATESVQ